MGKRKMVLARIENPVNRRVTFAKRKMGVLKKAHELSVLCDVEIALITISEKGKQYQFGSPNLEKAMSRYIQFCASNQDFNHKSQSIEMLQVELENLQKMMDNVEKTNQHMIGEEIDSLNLRELCHLEKQLQKGLRKICSTKVKLFEENVKSLMKQCTDQNVVDPLLDLRGRLCDDQLYKDEDEDERAQEHDPTQLFGFEASLELKL